MNISTEDVAEAVLVNFRRLSPTDRRQILQQLMSDLDAPQQTDEAPEGANGRELGAAIPSSGLLGWWEENIHRTDLVTVLQQYLPEVTSDALDDPQKKLAIERRLSGLSPLILNQIHQSLAGRARKGQGLTPDQILELTWGTIRGTDPAILREIIEDEEYCGY
jgi:hypothetical protein